MNFSKYLKGYKCVFIDLYGFGAYREDKVYTFDDYIVGIEKIIKKENLKDVVLVGHSMGGRFAIFLASYLKNVKGLVLVDAAGLKPKLTIKKFMRILKYKIYKILKLNTNSCGSKDYKSLSKNMKKTFVNIVNFYLDDRLKFIKIQTLIIWGKKDRETPLYMAHKLNRGIQNSELIIIDSDHFAYAKKYNEFILVLKAYLDGIY